MSKVKTDRDGFVSNATCDCGGALKVEGRGKLACERCGAVTTAAKLFLKLNTPVVH